MTPNRIRKLRDARGISLEVLAEASGVARNSINQIERGRAELTLPKMRAIAKALGVAPSMLLNDEDVECRAGGPLAAVLETLRPLPEPEAALIAQIAQTLLGIARSLTARGQGIAFEGDAVEVAALAKRWNLMSDAERNRAITLLSASGLGDPGRSYEPR